jgi:hypothetical protein
MGAKSVQPGLGTGLEKIGIAVKKRVRNGQNVIYLLGLEKTKFGYKKVQTFGPKRYVC